MTELRDIVRAQLISLRDALVRTLNRWIEAL